MRDRSFPCHGREFARARLRLGEDWSANFLLSHLAPMTAAGNVASEEWERPGH